MPLYLRLKDPQTQFIIGWVQIHHQAALHPAFDTIFQIFNFTRRTIRRNDNLLILIDQSVKRVKKFFLGAVFSGYELYIFHHHYIHRPEQLFEIHHFAFAQRLHEPIHELFCRKIKNV